MIALMLLIASLFVCNTCFAQNPLNIDIQVNTSANYNSDYYNNEYYEAERAAIPKHPRLDLTDQRVDALAMSEEEFQRLSHKNRIVGGTLIGVGVLSIGATILLAFVPSDSSPPPNPNWTNDPSDRYGECNDNIALQAIEGTLLITGAAELIAGSAVLIADAVRTDKRNQAKIGDFHFDWKPSAVVSPNYSGVGLDVHF